MKQDYRDYLLSVGIDSSRPPLWKRIGEAIKAMELLSPEPLVDILLTEGKDEEDRMIAYSLWLFSPNYVLERRNIQDDAPRYYVYILKNSVITLELGFHNYDWKEGTLKSWVILNVGLASDRSLNLRATSRNCDNVKQIYEKYIKPNYRVPHSESVANGSPIVPLPVG